MPSLRFILLLTFVLVVRGAAQEPFSKAGVPFLEKYCTNCHGAGKKKADLALHEFRDDTSLLKQRKTWKHVLEMVREGEMPPDDKPQPTAAERDAFLASAKAVFANYDAKGKADPGRVTIRRLNRNEYNNTLRDLLGIDAQPANDFPSDGIGYGFDNIGDVLSLSPLLMERFLDAAQTVAELAVPLEPAKPPVKHLDARYWEPAGRDIPMRGDWRELTPGKDAIGTGPLHTPFAVDPGASYTLRAQVWVEAPPTRTVRVAFLAAGANLANPEPPARFTQLEADKVPQVAKCRVIKPIDITARTQDKPQIIEAKLTGMAGVDRLALALVRDVTATNPPTKLFVKWIEIVGPEDVRTPFLRRWAQAAPGKTPAQQTRVMLSYFMPRAWHRPVAPDEIERVARVADAAMKRGETWEAGVRQALIAVLSSPKFLFRMEIDDQPENPEPHPINEFQLATRLSYFLWSTCPDDELLKYALSNQLAANLEAQIRRMLKDPRAEELVDNFAMQWLQLRRLANHQADPKTFERWKPGLKDSMLTETRLFFAEIIREDRSVLDLLDADFTYLDRRLAEAYNIKPEGGFEGDNFRRVSLAGTPRGGLLTQASVLTVTSNPTRTSPVKRGKWILEQILGDPPPPPPAVVPSLDDESRTELSGTFRQRLEQHRADPKCGNCHAKMDTMGFALENFNGIGQWRETNEQGQPVEVGGKLPKGPELKSLADLKKMLREEKDQFAHCLTEKMLIYALGRGLEYYDDRATEKIEGDLAKGGYKFSALVTAIAKSDPFRLRRGKGQGDN
jgi:hypothetical protein